jgi:hypothetical protein
MVVTFKNQNAIRQLCAFVPCGFYACFLAGRIQKIKNLRVFWAAFFACTTMYYEPYTAPQAPGDNVVRTLHRTLGENQISAKFGHFEVFLKKNPFWKKVAKITKKSHPD